MIQINDKKNCCGCGACEQRCPQHCISLQSDEQGFLYPNVNEKACVNCKICEKVCPVINTKSENEPLTTYAAINPNKSTRLKSSSGGVFSLLAERTIKEGGVVFGARFNEKWEVIHDYASTINEIDPFRGSKYVQSAIRDNFKKAEYFLKKDKQVLFSGTPCQIAGLKSFLRKDYSNLITVEVACHGVSSPLIWKSYLEQIKKNGTIKTISFRNKSKGWKNFCFLVEQETKTILEPFNENIYMRGFLENIFLRPSCYECPFKAGRSLSDFTIADFWGIQFFEELSDDDLGTSLVLVNTLKGQSLWNQTSLNHTDVIFERVLPFNIALVSCVKKNNRYDFFWKEYSKVGIDAISRTINKKNNLLKRTYNKLKIRINK